MVQFSYSCIGHNEKDHLQQLLPKLLQYGDEVVYVDCESSDGSLEFAKELGCKTFSRPNNPNLNVNKSFGFENSNSEWIFYIDPDERITKELAEEIHTIIQSNPIENAFRLARRNFFFGKWLKHGSQYPDYQVRLFRKTKASFANLHVHEKLNIQGKTGQLKNYMDHYPYLTVKQFLEKFNFYTSFDAEFLKQQNVKINFVNTFKYLLFKPLTRFTGRYILKGGFLNGIPGFFAAFFDAAGWVVRYVKLWELNKR